MPRFLEKCRQCYALIGLAVIVAAILGAWSAGWAANEMAHAVGFLPFDSENCRLRTGCRTETYTGPESVFGLMVLGALVAVLGFVLWRAARFAFTLLEDLGHDVVLFIRERKA